MYHMIACSNDEEGLAFSERTHKIRVVSVGNHVFIWNRVGGIGQV